MTETKPVTWVCKDCKTQFTNREAAVRHVKALHRREPKPDLASMFEEFFKGLPK